MPKKALITPVGQQVLFPADLSRINEFFVTIKGTNRKRSSLGLLKWNTDLISQYFYSCLLYSKRHQRVIFLFCFYIKTVVLFFNFSL